MDTTKRYKAVFFDLGGTLRIALLEEPWMKHARRKMAEIAGSPVPYEEFYQMIEERYEPYRKWALAENKESGDEELWCKWLLPDYDQARIKQVCHELSFQYRQCKGRRIVVDGGVEVIKGLHERGYKLGIISNLIGENEVPDWLEEDGLDQYFDSVVLSSVCGMRKPCFEIYQLAAKEMGVELEECVSVADNIKRDIPGAKKAGVGCNIIFSSPEKKHPVEYTEENRPDAVIEDFREILNLLPSLQEN
ncbi:MAG: HAD family hydrolase [Oscillibacter sp.]|jgi:putative hydrolase of the HAD superfamily|uniref:HAD family hydrolase n=1 Tax=uncultured Oscillibacter sp. TaxID=876091 RepID=UPI00217392F7|nr:HAD family hydrolase [uncultured Oscillibacter sp.]MCI9644230.1 HAD family hydrolase [Oscillibacter sp.]